METENENLDSLNQEEIITPEDGENQVEPDLDALKKVKEELSDKNKKLFERAKKSEGDVKELREKLKKYEDKPEDKNLDKSQSNEPDYAKLAFLKGEGITHPDDQKWVQDEAARLKLPLTDILAMEHAKSHLETNKIQREALAGMPKGKGSSGGKTQGDVDYWIDQKNPDGSFKTPDDQILAEKVIAARISKEKSANKFADDLYTG